LHDPVAQLYLLGDLGEYRLEVGACVDGRRSIAEHRTVRWHPADMTAPLALDLQAIFRNIV